MYNEGKFSSKAAFLDSAVSGDDISAKHRRSFNRALSKYNGGKLNESDRKRERHSIYEPVRKKLLSYIELRSRLYQQDKCGLSYTILKEKADNMQIS
ncbi:MAG: hypothetical protein ACREBR_02035 [bacterium]